MTFGLGQEFLDDIKSTINIRRKNKTMKYHYTVMRMSIIKENDSTKCQWEYENTGTLYTLLVRIYIVILTLKKNVSV